MVFKYAFYLIWQLHPRARGFILQVHSDSKIVEPPGANPSLPCWITCRSWGHTQQLWELSGKLAVLRTEGTRHCLPYVIPHTVAQVDIVIQESTEVYSQGEGEQVLHGSLHLQI